MSYLPAKKSLGQHFLTSPIVPGWMCDAAAVTSDDVVLEIGPGTGVLTREILARGATVYALEADPRAITILEDEFTTAIQAGQLIVRHVDARSFTPADLPDTITTYKVVANIPYYLSGLLFRTFLDTDRQPQTLVYLVQKEVAKRITSSLARGEKESLLALSVKAFGSPSYIKTVTKGHFNPPPKVDSAIVAVYDINRTRFATISSEFFFTVLHLGLGKKRKQLFGALKARFSSETLMAAFAQVDIPHTIRGEDLTIDQWGALVAALPAPD